MGNIFSEAWDGIKSMAPAALTVFGAATGDPLLMAAGSALGSLGSSDAQNSAIDQANNQAVTNTQYQNQLIDWQNKRGQVDVQNQNAEIARQNTIEKLTTDWKNQQITSNNTVAKLNYDYRNQQIDAYNARGEALSAMKQGAIQAALQNTYGSLTDRGSQEILRSNQERSQRISQGIRERASTVSNSVESGATGRSLDRMSIASAISQATDTGTIDTNLKFTQQQLQREAFGSRNQAQGQLNESVFYDVAKDIAPAMTPLLPASPTRALQPDYIPQPHQGQPTLAPKLSGADIAVRAAGAGLSTYFGSGQNFANTPASPGDISGISGPVAGMPGGKTGSFLGDYSGSTAMGGI